MSVDTWRIIPVTPTGTTRLRGPYQPWLLTAYPSPDDDPPSIGALPGGTPGKEKKTSTQSTNSWVPCEPRKKKTYYFP